jgi:hypothetical protein
MPCTKGVQALVFLRRHSSPWRWRKEGVTVEQQRRDQAECAAASDRAYNASTGDTAVRAAAASRVAEDCFRAKNYYSPAR